MQTDLRGGSIHAQGQRLRQEEAAREEVMPAVVRKSGSGYKAFSHKDGKPLSKASKSKAAAVRQARAVNAQLHKKRK
jgi:hypothetical protein